MISLVYSKLDYDFTGKTVLDLGANYRSVQCNMVSKAAQGGKTHFGFFENGPFLVGFGNKRSVL